MELRLPKGASTRDDGCALRRAESDMLRDGATCGGVSVAKRYVHTYAYAARCYPWERNCVAFIGSGSRQIVGECRDGGSMRIDHPCLPHTLSFPPPRAVPLAASEA